MAQDTSRTGAGSVPSPEDYQDIKRILAHLTTLVERGQVATGPSGAPTADDIAGSDAAFRYRMLSALMGAGSLDNLAVAVVRDRDDLVIRRPAGITRGTHLAFVAEEQVNLELVNDRLSAAKLKQAGVDIHGTLDQFVLRDGPLGPVVAIAPSLDPIPAPVPVPTP